MYPDDRVYLIDLETKGYEAVRDNDTPRNDNLHPNNEGSALLADLIYDALTPLAIKNLTGTVDSDTGITLLWEYPDSDNNGIIHINTDYLIEYQVNGVSTWITYATIP
jgi:hypothetical protein